MPRGIPTKLIIGAVYSRLKVIEFSHSDGALWWRFLCLECNNEVVLRGTHVTNGSYKSCGCWRGATHGKTGTPTFRIWSHMKQRCTNPNDGKYREYGGRGIAVCDRWLESFDNFLEDMGEKPNGKTIDRIDNNSDYTPQNCRWATPRQQANNTRRNRTATVDGVRKTIAQWSRISGVKSAAIRYRLEAGWPTKRAIFEPARKCV